MSGSGAACAARRAAPRARASAGRNRWGREMLAEQLRVGEVELQSADEVHVERVEVAQQRREAEPAPARACRRRGLRCAVLRRRRRARRDCCGYGTSMTCASARRAGATAQELARARSPGPRPTFTSGTSSQSSRSAASKRAERVRDAAPLLHGRVPRIAPVDHVPHERADDAEGSGGWRRLGEAGRTVGEAAARAARGRGDPSLLIAISRAPFPQPAPAGGSPRA